MTRYSQASASLAKARSSRGEILPLGRGRVLREGNNIAIISLDPRLGDALKAADELAARGLPATVMDAASPSRSTPRWSNNWRATTRS